MPILRNAFSFASYFIGDELIDGAGRSPAILLLYFVRSFASSSSLDSHAHMKFAKVMVKLLWGLQGGNPVALGTAS